MVHAPGEFMTIFWAAMANTIYHLSLGSDWTKTVKTDSIYYPPTYEQDGFTHGTANPEKLLQVANHFYRASKGDWVCLAMTEAAINKTGVQVKFEPAANVGDQDGKLEGEAELFPHLYGGIAPAAVHGVYAVVRDETGGFVSIDLPDSV